jgi:AcrR family transcriptional regulator
VPQQPEPVTEIARRDQLVDSAIQLIAEQGHARASLSRIAKRAGVSKAAVLYYFKTKDDLLDAVLARVLGGLKAQIESSVRSTADPVEAVFAYLRSMVAYLTANPAHVRLIAEAPAIAELAGHPYVRADPDRWQPFADLLAAAQKSGQLRDFDTKPVAILIGGAVDGLVAQWLAEPGFDLSKAAAELETFVRRATSA